jgi:DNA repair/transcription protein MET18/MMS19
VGNWAASVQQWMTPASADDDKMEDDDEGGSGDIIARAKGESRLFFSGAGQKLTPVPGI